MVFVKDRKSPMGTGMNRRQFLGSGACFVMAGASLFLASGTSRAEGGLPQGWSSPSNGSTDPYPIPWLDKNGSHNQSPGPKMEPSSIYHFKGRVARCNAFTGMGTDNEGNRISFGAPSTDFSFMEGEYFAARAPQSGIFSHV